MARLVAAEQTSSEQASASTQSQRVAQAFQTLAGLRKGVSLDLPLRDAIEHGRD